MNKEREGEREGERGIHLIGRERFRERRRGSVIWRGGVCRGTWADDVRGYRGEMYNERHGEDVEGYGEDVYG